jgi:beta-glucosidase
VNYYHGDAVSGRPNAAPTDHHGAAPRIGASAFPSAEHVSFPRRGLPLTDMGWEVQAEGLQRLLVRLRDDYAPPPIYITETGAAYVDVLADGEVHDPERVAFMEGYLRAVHGAILDGVDVRGVFWWSFLDNFEWAYGYGKRFGIVHVDYETQRRTPKSSAHWYAAVARTGMVSTSSTEGSSLP